MKNIKNLIKAWEAVKTVKRNAVLREREFAVEMRKEFETGDVGDREFLETATKHFNEPLHVAQYLLALAFAARAFPGEEEFYNRVGKAVKYLARLPTKEQSEVLTLAKKQTKTVQTVIREREIAAGLREPPDKVSTGNTGRMRDIEMLARYIAENMPDAAPPREIETLIRMYVPAFRRAA